VIAPPLNASVSHHMDLARYIRGAFPDGLTYKDAAQLCLSLYCSTDGLPEALKLHCSKDGLAEVFASLARHGFVRGDTLLSSLYGANFHDVQDKGHWIEVIASLFKMGNTVDIQSGRALVGVLTANNRMERTREP